MKEQCEHEWSEWVRLATTRDITQALRYGKNSGFMKTEVAKKPIKIRVCMACKNRSLI